MISFDKVFLLIFVAEYFVSQSECVLTPRDQELFIAAGSGNAPIVSQLIAQGANVSAQYNQGMTPLHWAAENGHFKAAKVLIINGADFNAKDFFLNTPLHVACSHDHLTIVGMLLEFGADYSEINLGKTGALQMCTATAQFIQLMTNVFQRDIPLLDAIKSGQIPEAVQYIKNCANINVKFKKRTPLYEAITIGHSELAAWLTMNGADAYQSSPDGISLRKLAALKGIELPESVDRNSVIEVQQKRVHEWHQETLPQNKIAAMKRQNGHSLTWQAYHPLKDIESFLKYLATKYSRLCTLLTIEKTYEGRPLLVLRISNSTSSSRRAIWIDGGIHAREWISPAAVTYIANDLVMNWSRQPEHVQNVNWYILAVHNPDGYEFSHKKGNRFWRKNRSTKVSTDCIGVDLNRNYGYDWGGNGSVSDPCNLNYAGKGAFSELETKAVQRFFQGTKENFGAFLTFHSHLQFLFYPNDNLTPSDREDLERVGQDGVKNMKAVDNETYTLGKRVSYATPGSSDRWARSIGIKYSYTIELRDRGRYGFLLPVKYIEPTAKEAKAFVWTVSQAVFHEK